MRLNTPVSFLHFDIGIWDLMSGAPYRKRSIISHILIILKYNIAVILTQYIEKIGVCYKI